MTKVMLTTSMMNQRPGDIISVRPGYARNRLIPMGLAIRIRGNEEKVKLKMEEWNKKDEEARIEAEKYAEKLKDLSLEIKVESGVGNTLYGSITSANVSHMLKEDYQINISKSDIIMDPIKLLGQYKVKVNLYGGSHVEINLLVSPIG